MFYLLGIDEIIEFESINLKEILFESRCTPILIKIKYTFSCTDSYATSHALRTHVYY